MENSPKLVHNLATGKWILRLNGEFWQIDSTSAALELAGFLQVHVVDQSGSDYLIVVKGTAVLDDEMPEIGRCALILTPLVKTKKQKRVILDPEMVDFGFVECHYGIHDDQWVATEAVLSIEHIKTLGLKFFLPDVADMDGKELAMFIGDKKIKTANLTRGDTTEIWVDVPENGSIRQLLTIKSAYKEPNSKDERDLGMIFVEYNPNLTEWISVKELL
ncbi:MAG: hypothetical protein HKN36_03845 [Hellea sp.]|nr:hypothetical protein [Hellea sp.]